MKKFFLFVLIVLMAFAMVACKDEPEQKSGDALPVEKEAGKDALIEQGASAKAVDHTGFKIVATMQEGGNNISFNIGGKNNIYWYEISETSMLFTEHNGSTYLFVPVKNASFWLKVAEKSIKEEVFTDVVDALLYNAYEYKDSLSYIADETKFGRSCAKYSISATVEGVNYSLTIWVDKEFGITMGLESAAGSETVNFTINPKLSNIGESDLPTNYSVASTCVSFLDTMPTT